METLVFVLLSSIHGLKREMLLVEDFGRIEPAAYALSRLVIHGLKA
jgi:hypothetical protein